MEKQNSDKRENKFKVVLSLLSSAVIIAIITSSVSNSTINILNRYKQNQQLNYKNINKVTTLYFQNGKLVA
ncbi:hypothetical protein [Clostridium kluyveri]|uniref:Uncharacterized protein n=1 Tax=Clostridium kluyveri TaxID=1534 RepID=A0A1L5F2Q2_CLOKL|nr:hypothetical protein [Clostridium kluyveri]APM37285.1 hypothetical protein BS101_00150 [Clostridium kluyveri]UZQ48554.1 hypothetical protein OP486_11085 [Clostridium kluyveri]